RQLGTVAVQKNIGENWNGIAPLDHAMNMAQGLQQFRTLYGDFHCEIHEESRNTGSKGGPTRGFRQARCSSAACFSMPFHRDLPGWGALKVTRGSRLNPGVDA